MTFGDTLRTFRGKKGVSQGELARIVGLDATYLSKIEHEKRNPLGRDVVLELARALDLNETDTDELLASARYQPQTLFDLGFDTNDVSLKKHLGVLRDIKNKAPLASYIRAKDEIANFLDLMRMKYTQEIDENLSQNTLLADYLYSKIRRGGLRALYEEVNRPLGGAVVIHNNKILLHQIGISPLKGTWLIPAGYVNPEKGDKTAKDIAIRMVRKCLGDVKLEVRKELTAPGEKLDDLDTSEYAIKLGMFPTIVQLYLVEVEGKTLPKTNEGAGFFRFEDISKIHGEIHPLVAQIIKPYVKDEKLIAAIYKRGEQMIATVLKKKHYMEDMKEFDRKRRRRL